MSSNKPKILAVVGPTASGKTALAIRLAQKFDGEIVSADSRQIYRGMDIGTAKPDFSLRDSIPHYLIDIKNPDEDYTVAQYKIDATNAINKIIERKKLPIVAGGTGLYVSVILENFNVPRVQSNPELRAQLEKEIETNGLASVFKKLVALDPEAAYVVDPNNPRRVVRALEVAIVTGEPFTAQRLKNPPLFDVLTLGIMLGPEELRERINRRVDEMMENGLLEEVQSLINKYGEEITAFDAIGYREIITHLRGQTSLAQAISEMKMNTWHYAKRQITWFKKDKNIHWIKDLKEAEELTEEFLKK